MSRAERAGRGILLRHQRWCPASVERLCVCVPSFLAHVYVARARRKLRRTFPTLAEAEEWRAEALEALRNGEPVPVVPRLDPAEKFTARVGEPDEHGCLPWLGIVGVNGYGKFAHDGRQTRAHRWAWEQEHGPIPRGLHLHHDCRNKLCVNVEHLRLVTASEHARFHADTRKVEAMEAALDSAQDGVGQTREGYTESSTDKRPGTAETARA
jgi:HNH endonuclease